MSTLTILVFLMLLAILSGFTAVIWMLGYILKVLATLAESPSEETK